MIDPEKQLVSFILPAGISLTRRKINNLKIVLVGIAKIERLNSSRGFDRWRQSLRRRRNELHFQRAQFIERLVHIAYDDGDMLKPKIIAARILRNGSARRGQILGQIEIFIPELHPYDPHPRTEDAFEVLKFVAED